ncbi:MAG: hypothetical protein ACLRUZ_11675 [Faecalimonas sp.]
MNTEKAIKQFIFVGISMIISLIVPVVIRKMKSLAEWTYIYAGMLPGLAALTYFVTSGGAKLGFLLGIEVSGRQVESICIFVAAGLRKSTDFKNVVITTAIAAAHVLILVASTGHGSCSDFVYFIHSHGALCGDKATALSNTEECWQEVVRQ